MKKSKILDKLKKTLIVTMCSITLFFAMPIKTNASAIDNVMYIFRVIPDGLMVLINKFVGDDPVEETSKMISVDDAIDIKFDASVYNFNVLPDRIFSSGTIDSNGETILPLLDTNFFRNTNDNENSADILRPVISNVYYNLRNLVIILMLVVLLYVGVRIIISSASNNKAKYKKMLQAWGGGMCLIFCMQYIMSFCMFLNQKIISILAMKNQESQYYYIATEQKLDVETMSLSATGTAAENVEKVIDFSNALNNAEAMIGKEGLWGTVVTVVPEGVDTATDILMEGASNIASGISDVADDVADTTKDWWFVGDAASNVASDVSKATSDLAKWIDKTHYNEETEDIMEGSARCLELTQDRRFIAEHFLEINQEDENLKIFEFNFFEYSKLTSDGKLKNDTSSEWKIASQYIFIDSEGNLYVLYKKETNIKPSAIICDNSKIGLGTGIWAYLQVISGNYLGAAFATQDLIPTEDSPFNSCNSIYKGNVLEYFRTVASTDTEEILFVNHKNKEVTEGSFLLSIGYSVLYIILALEVVVFVYQYIKRVIKLAFLTMISPVIALLYPIDAVGDGSAQTFNTWFKEYFFNSLIQPLHMILYTIFISSAMQLLANNNGELNVVYAIVIYAYMIPAETFMKKLFGFNKAATTGLDNAAAGMLTLKGMDLLKSLSSNNSRSNAGNQNSQRARVRQREIPAGIGIMGGPGPTGGGPAPTGRGPTPPRGGPEPTGRGPTPTGVGPAPTRVGPDPTGRGPTPPRGGPEPTGRGPTPTGVGPAPTRVGPDPTGRGPTPPRGGPEPTGRGPTPTGVGPAPIGGGPTPTVQRNRFRFFTSALDTAQGNFVRRITGGATNRINHIEPGDVARTAGRFVGTKIARGATTLGTTVAGAGAGLIIGTAASALTGKNSLVTPILAGTIFGYAQGGTISDSVLNKTTNFIDQTQDNMASNDEVYGAERRTNRFIRDNLDLFENMSRDERNRVSPRIRDLLRIKGINEDDIKDNIKRIANTDISLDNNPNEAFSFARGIIFRREFADNPEAGARFLLRENREAYQQRALAELRTEIQRLENEINMLERNHNSNDPVVGRQIASLKIRSLDLQNNAERRRAFIRNLMHDYAREDAEFILDN